jgi:hypothetical protein
MKPTYLILVALLLIPLIRLHAAERSPGTGRSLWPPEYMKALPADYLDRLHRALEVQLESIDKLTPDANPVLWVRFAIAGLTLDRQVDLIMNYLEADDFAYQPSDKFGFSLFSMPYVRLYGLFNDHHGKMQGRLSRKAQTNLEQTLWACASVNSKLEEAQRGVWEMDGSENHHLSSKVSDFLVAQFFKDIPAYARRKYDDGSTAQEQYAARLSYWHQWIESRVRRGLFMEDGGSSYENYTLEALFNLRDFAEDRLLREKADMFLDVVFANMAEETLGVQRGGPKTRTKEEEFRSRSYDLLFDAPGDRFELSNYILPTSSYYSPPAIVSLAKDLSTRGAYAFTKTAPGAVAHGTTAGPGSKWRTMDHENLMRRKGFATAHYLIGSHDLDTAAKSDPYRAQRWQGVVFADDPQARIGMDGKSGETKGGYISNPFKTIQDRNVMVTMKWGPIIDRKTDPHLWIYFSSTLDTVEEEGEWIFVKSGQAYAAVKIVEGGYRWSRPWKHHPVFSVQEKSFVTPNSETTPILMIANDAADYDDDFQAFKQAIVAEPLSWKDGVLRFTTIVHEGPFNPGRVGGIPIHFKTTRVNDSPFIRSAFDSGLVFIRKGNETLKLDFSDPNKPIKTVNALVTPEFPSGIGTATPVVPGR